MQTLNQIAKEIVTQGDMRNPTYHTLTDYQRNNLINAAIQEKIIKAVNPNIIREINDALEREIITLALKRQFTM